MRPPPLKQWQFVTLDQHSHFVDKSIKDQLTVQGNGKAVHNAQFFGTKEMASEKMRIKIKTLNLSESVFFQVHPAMYPGNISYKDDQLMRKYRHFDVLPDDHMDPLRVKVILGQDNYHLLFPAAYKKSIKNPGLSTRNSDRH